MISLAAVDCKIYLKGETRQNRWVEQVERAIGKVKEPGLKQLLEQIRGFDNIPRKEAKFINFLQNSIRIRNRDLCVKVFISFY